MYNFDRIIEHFSRMNNLEGAGTDYPFMLFVYLGLFLFCFIANVCLSSNPQLRA